MSVSTETGEHSRTRPRWKNYPEAIKYILGRTIPPKPLPRGTLRKLYPDVADEVNERFDFGGKKADEVGIKYVTEKYGSDPVFGNRKMQVVHPVKGRAGARDKKNLMRAKRAVENGGGRFVICPHCEGNGYVQVAADEEDDPFQDSQGLSSVSPAPMNYGGYGAVVHPGPANPNVGANAYQGMQPSMGDHGFMMGPAPTAHTQGGYYGPPQSGQTTQLMPRYPQPSTAAPMMGNNLAYENAQGYYQPNQMPQNGDAWNSTNDLTGRGAQNEQSFEPAVEQNRFVLMPPTNRTGWQNTMPMNTNTPNSNAGMQQYGGQMNQSANMPQAVQPAPVDPVLQSGTAYETPLTGGGNVTARTPRTGMYPQPDNQIQAPQPSNAGTNVGQYGDSSAGYQVPASAQPGTVAENQPSGAAPVADAYANADANGYPDDFPMDNAENGGYQLTDEDLAWLNNPDNYQEPAGGWDPEFKKFMKGDTSIFQS